MRNSALFDEVCAALTKWSCERSIATGERRFRRNKAGEFDGLSINLNHAYPLDERTFYFTHAIGSIVAWHANPVVVRELFRRLRAKQQRRVEVANSLRDFRDFEEDCSAFAVWLLERLGFDHVIAAYTNFMRADMDALTRFHRDGALQVWRPFFARWNRRHKSRAVAPFEPKPIQAFAIGRIPKQVVLQRQS